MTDTKKSANELEDAKEAFDQHVDAWRDNRDAGLEDLRFARLDDQWPDYAKKLRGQDRPMLTINKLAPVIRQVVNDSRQNRPSIKVRPVDNGADVRTARVYDGLIRNIEQISSADVAYDTAVDHAVSMGFGFWRIGIEYAHDDSFDKDLRIERIANARSVWPDPYSTAADSSDWNSAFVCEQMAKGEFERRYKGAEVVDWDAAGLKSPWIDGDDVTVAEYWYREEEEREIHRLSTGAVVADEVLKLHLEVFQAMGISVLNSRKTRGFCVYQKLMTGAEVLETNKWAGKYIPIVACYGDEVNEDGKRHFRSLIRSAKDAQRMFNFWRTTSTELVALAPKAPWLVHEDALPEDAAEAQKWKTGNIDNHAMLLWGGNVPPSRQPFAGPPAGALQEALNASDDIKAITGLYDASLGARSNETSGIAIERRKMEGDTSTFHFIDNLSRAITHCGRILIDLIPKVYTGERMIRVLGEDGKGQHVQIAPRPQEAQAQMLAQPAGPMQPGAQPPQGPQMQPGMPQGDPNAPEPGSATDPLDGVFDLSAGKYDLVVTAGPSYSTRRVEAASEMSEVMAKAPDLMKVGGDILIRNMDWPGAEELADRLKKLLPAQLQGQSPNDAAFQQQIQQLTEAVQKLTGENQELKLKNANKSGELQIDAREAETKQFEAETDRLKVAVDAAKPEPQPAPQAGF